MEGERLSMEGLEALTEKGQRLGAHHRGPGRQGQVGTERSQVCDSDLEGTSATSLTVRIDLVDLSG